MKSILDACCGGKMFYYDKNDERVLFQDIRNISTHLCDGRLFEVKPDVQADFTNMPYEDETFYVLQCVAETLTIHQTAHPAFIPNNASSQTWTEKQIV